MNKSHITETTSADLGKIWRFTGGHECNKIEIRSEEFPSYRYRI